MSRRPYERPMHRTRWYFGHARYRTYMLREMTCVLVTLYCALLLAGLAALASGQAERWAGFLSSQQHLGWLVFHAFALVYFTVFQSAPWFRLAPKAMPLPESRFPVATRLVIAAHYLAWLALSGLVLRITGVI